MVSHGHRPWKKIIVIDSLLRVSTMEGEQCKLPEIIAVCKKKKKDTKFGDSSCNFLSEFSEDKHSSVQSTLKQVMVTKVHITTGICTLVYWSGE